MPVPHRLVVQEGDGVVLEVVTVLRSIPWHAGCARLAGVEHACRAAQPTVRM